MSILGIVLHHSACPSINGTGYDYFVCADGTIVAGAEPTDPHYVHVCLEGDFSVFRPLTAELQEQLFVAVKLFVALAARHGFDPTDLHPHSVSCPGRRFPWRELVLSRPEGYH
ncbi:N-acetylmuramoyl-L-alanine amidase [Paenibacillus thermoaerophilus]|uniref:N-acetylmuramoyl-L-alanine amidase n=1 Tax=Paenibacillus thermoaerophilus TaxID=1215385 RepID=A0ABW2V5V3_9BACL|nr:N-acetylmuramoyl-L-alanine amidase [Paenibacillus thermoaerophilus]TMV07508.1 N-acetylmuramoyl-L-alanine amidase [Paenibacillus thermoaerophilus]